MDLLTSLNHGGPQKCLKAKANVDRPWGKPVALVAASMSALFTMGCVSLDAPPSLLDSTGPVSLLEFDLPPIAENDPLHFANEEFSASDNGAWLFAPNDGVVAPPIPVAIDFDPLGIDPHLWVSHTDLRLEFESVAAPGLEPAIELADSQVVPVDVQPTLAAPAGTLVSLGVSLPTMISRQDVWQGVMKATAVGFLAVVLLVPLCCSFVAGVVCSRRRAGPRRRRTKRRAPVLRMSSLSRAIANVPSH